MLYEMTIDCPYCGESFATLVDTSGGSAEYIEDCQICCQPIVFDLISDQPPQLRVRRDNE